MPRFLPQPIFFTDFTLPENQKYFVWSIANYRLIGYNPFLMPPEARVVIFEDSPIQNILLEAHLEASRHSIVGRASNMEEANKLIAALGELKPDAAIIDGDLGSGAGQGEDGKTINRDIKAFYPNIITIGFSTNMVEGVDVDLGKSNYDKIGQTVTEI